jgi:transposase
MSKPATQQLSKKLLEQIYAEVEARVEAKFTHRIECLEKEVERWKDEAHIWRARYFKQQERSEKLEGQLSLAQAEIRALKEVIQKQATEITQLRKQVYGRKSEVVETETPEKPVPQKRSRGRQYGDKGSGRRKRDTLDVIERLSEFPPEEMVCICCGLPFEEAGEKQSEQIEFEVIVKRVIYRRKTVRRTCKCPTTPAIKTMPAPLRLFRGTAYSIGLWHFIIFDKYHLQRPLNRTVKLLSSYGLDVGASVFVNGLKRLHDRKAFKPLVKAIENRIKGANRQQKDETGWKIFQEIEGKQGYQHWLSVTLSDDCCWFQLDPSRSREVAKRSIGNGPVIVTSDMLKIYQNLGDNVVNSWCWAHVRRYLLKLATRPNLAESAAKWVSKVDWLYHCNNQRLNASNQAAYDSHDAELHKAIREFERQAKSNAERHTDPEAKKVFCMIAEHWDGLALFVEFPAIPMDNNLSEQALRNSVLGRKSYYGSGSCWSGELAADLFTIFATLEMNKIDVRTWLYEYLTAVAKYDGNAPPEALQFLPWNSPPVALLEHAQHVHE